METDAFDRQTAGYLIILILMAIYDVSIQTIPVLFYVGVHLLYLRLFHSALQQHGRSLWWLVAALISGPLAGIVYAFRDRGKDKR